jgi:hypothetical protein
MEQDTGPRRKLASVGIPALCQRFDGMGFTYEAFWHSAQLSTVSNTTKDIHMCKLLTERETIQEEELHIRLILLTSLWVYREIKPWDDISLHDLCRRL